MRNVSALFAVACLASPGWANDDNAWLAPLIVPEGFAITTFANDEQAHSIHSLTFDSLGRCVVSGPEYVKILEDRDADGRCDSVKTFLDVGPGGLHGMCFVGRTLYGVDARGVFRAPDDDADDRADRVERIGPELRGGGEHGPHGIVLGPDGWLYAVFGNNSHFESKHITTAASPVRRAVQGSIVRMTLDGRRCEAVTTGFRNPYDLAFNRIGELFTVDSDNEGELGLPFYRYPRLVHAVPGGDVGWRDTDDQWPDDWPDTIPPACDMGRGSPAGMVCYEHTRFPRKYHGSLLVADWSWARIVAFYPKRVGATWTATREDLVRTPERITTETHGERDYASGFYPSDLAVAPDGSVYIALGGRDTLGVVYRLDYVGDATARAGDSVAALSHDELTRLIVSTDVDASVRIDAMRRWMSSVRARAIPDALLQALCAADAPELRAMTVDLLRIDGQNDSARHLVRLMNDSDALVRRRAMESWPAAQHAEAYVTALVAGLNDTDHLCRHAAARALEQIEPDRWREKAGHHASLRVRLWAALVDTWGQRPALTADAYWALVRESIQMYDDSERRIEALRVLERLLDRGFVSWNARDDEATIADRLGLSFPSSDWRVNRQLVNLLARTDNERTAELLLGHLASAAARPERIHTLSRLARMNLSWRGEPLQRLVRTWIDLTHVDEAAATSGEMLSARWLANAPYWSRFYREDPATVVDELIRAEHEGEALAGPIGRLDEDAFARVWPRLRDRYLRLDGRVRRTVLTQLGRTLLPESADFVRNQIDDPAVRSAALRALRRFGRSEDHAVFVRSLRDDDPSAVQAAIDVVKGMDLGLSAEVIFSLLHQLALSVDRPERRALRDGILDLLEDRAAHPPTRRPLASTRDELQMVLDWQEWFIDMHPDFAEPFPPLRDPERSRVDRRNVAGELLRRVDWSRGDAEAGRRQFVRLGCANCHVHEGVGRALGPDLTGVGKRLSRRDLLEAIVLPSKTVPPRYQFTLFRLRTGEIVGGMLNQRVGDMCRIVTGTGDTLEVHASAIVEQVPQARSLMPTGTLDPAGDQDVADLLAFLATGKPPDPATSE